MPTLRQLLATVDEVADNLSHLPDAVRLPVEKAAAAVAVAEEALSAAGNRMLVKDLPAAVQKALKSVGYGRRDIAVEAGETFSAAQGGGQGKKAFSTLVNLSNGDFKTTEGSWGGANIANPTNQTDLDTRVRPLPEGFAVIQGSYGGQDPTYATVRVHPKTMATITGPALPAGPVNLSPKAMIALNAIGGLISSGRVNEFDREGLGRYGVDNPYVKELLAAGLVATNAKGAITITLAGKNARRR